MNIEDIVNKNDCLYALQAGNLDLKEANMIYDHFYNKGINWLLMEFILTIQQEDPDRLSSIVCELEDQQ
jgi:hypothetical protein